ERGDEAKERGGGLEGKQHGDVAERRGQRRLGLELGGGREQEPGGRAETRVLAEKLRVGRLPEGGDVAEAIRKYGILGNPTVPCSGTEVGWRQARGLEVGDGPGDRFGVAALVGKPLRAEIGEGHAGSAEEGAEGNHT